MTLLRVHDGATLLPFQPCARFVVSCLSLVLLFFGLGGEAMCGSVTVAIDMDGVAVSSGHPSVSADGRFVAFFSASSNIVPNDTNGESSGNGIDVFVRDRKRCTTERVSVSSDGAESDGDSFWQRVSADGRFVVFLSNGGTLVPNGQRGTRHVYLHDRKTRTTELVDRNTDGEASNGEAPLSFPAASANGRYVVFSSTSSDLVPGDTNGSPPETGATDVFAYDRKTKAMQLVSVDSEGRQGEGESFLGDTSADGRFVAFLSFARLSLDDIDDDIDLYLRDLKGQITRRIDVVDGSPVRPLEVSISDDGCVVAFSLRDRSGVGVHDCTKGSTSIEVESDVGRALAITGDGAQLALLAPASSLGSLGGAYLYDRVAHVSSLLTPVAFDVPSQLDISSDGRVLAYGASPVKVAGVLPDVPTSCEYPEGCSDASLKPLDELACEITTVGSVSDCAGDILPASVERGLVRAREAVRVVAAKDMTGRSTANEVGRVKRKLNRVLLLVKNAASRRVISEGCESALTDQLEGLMDTLPKASGS